MGKWRLGGLGPSTSTLYPKWVINTLLWINWNKLAIWWSLENFQVERWGAGESMNLGSLDLYGEMEIGGPRPLHLYPIPQMGYKYSTMDQLEQIGHLVVA